MGRSKLLAALRNRRASTAVALAVALAIVKAAQEAHAAALRRQAEARRSSAA